MYATRTLPSSLSPALTPCIHEKKEIQNRVTFRTIKLRSLLTFLYYT